MDNEFQGSNFDLDIVDAKTDYSMVAFGHRDPSSKMRWKIRVMTRTPITTIFAAITVVIIIRYCIKRLTPSTPLPSLDSSYNPTTMASDSPDCAMCNNPATYRCSSCRCNNLYCSKPCQVADWKLHKLLCKTRPLFEAPPTPSSRRAIAFLESGEIKFTWETIEIETDEDDGTQWESPVGIAEKYFGGERPRPQPYYSNAIRGRKLKECITLHMNDSFLLDGSPKNLAVCKVVPEMDDGGAVWRSALVAMKETNSWYDENRSFPRSDPGYGHMDMGDLREVVDYLTNWNKVKPR